MLFRTVAIYALSPPAVVRGLAADRDLKRGDPVKLGGGRYRGARRAKCPGRSVTRWTSGLSSLPGYRYLEVKDQELNERIAAGSEISISFKLIMM
jgi:hypothetical protein